MRYALILLMAAQISCTGWRTAASRTINGAKSLARSSEALEKKHCGHPMDLVKECKANQDTECKKFQRCEAMAKSLLTFQAAILVAQHALIGSQNKELVQGLVLAALKAYEPIKEIVEAWK